MVANANGMCNVYKFQCLMTCCSAVHAELMIPIRSFASEPFKDVAECMVYL